MSPYGFHPDASNEFTASIDYYAEINPRLAEEFISEVEHSISAICRNPERWRLVDGDVRRCLVHRFKGSHPVRTCFKTCVSFRKRVVRNV